MTDKKNAKGLRHLYADGPLHLYYDTLDDGTKVLRRIRVNQHTFATPDDGVIVDIPDNSVGTEQIKDGAVETEDLNQDVIDRMTHSYDSQNEGIKIGGFVQEAQTAPTVPTQPMNVEEEEEP